MYLPAQPFVAFGSCVRATVAEIIHLASSLFRRGNAGNKLRIRPKGRVVHPQGRKDISLRELIQH